MGAIAAGHPTDESLRAFGLGNLDESTAEPVKRHVEACSVCRRRVAQFSSEGAISRPRDVPGRSKSPVSGDSSLSSPSRFREEAGSAPPLASSLPPGLADHPDYEIVRELGQGGMGTVYLAVNRLMGRHEVLKVVSGHLVKRKGVLDRFLGEIRNAARLHHPNIVTSYLATRVGESIIFAMEYVDGLDLAKLVKAKGPLPVANACHYVYQAALGLQHAHDHGMVHRDIKPGNLMLASRGNRALIKVLDFGLAKVHSEGSLDSGLTHEGQMLGTPDYIAPEQIRDARAADIRADIYSLGCTLYYLLTGGPPFAATSLYELLQAHHSMDAMPLNLARPEVPGELAALVARMMAKEPADRFQTPAAVAQALTPFFKQSGPRLPNSSAAITAPATAKNEAGGVAWESLIAIPQHAGRDDSGSPKSAQSEPMFTERAIRLPTWMPLPLVTAASVVGLILLSVIIAITTSKSTVKVDPGDGKNAARIPVDDIVVESQPALERQLTRSKTLTDRAEPKSARQRAESRSPDRKIDNRARSWQAPNAVVEGSAAIITDRRLRQVSEDHHGPPSVAGEPGSPDPATAGSSWVGKRRFSTGNEQICELIINSRNKAHFEGEMTLLNAQNRSHFLTAKVQGDIVGQTVRFRSEKKGTFQQNFVGTLSDDRMQLRFNGTSKSGKPADGEATLILER